MSIRLAFHCNVITNHALIWQYQNISKGWQNLTNLTNINIRDYLFNQINQLILIKYDSDVV